jgi:uncharacterized Zn-binding protein involved in type VI secretion
MSLKIITVGDRTDHGGTVISGSPNHDIGGRPIERIGDQVDYPQSYPGGKPQGINKITTGHGGRLGLGRKQGRRLTWRSPCRIRLSILATSAHC